MEFMESNANYIGDNSKQGSPEKDVSIISNPNNESNIHLILDDKDINQFSGKKKPKGRQDTKYDNPAMQIYDFTQFSRNVCRELNQLRQYPALFAGKIEKLLKENFDEEDSYTLYINNYQIQLKEGTSAFIEAVRFLRKQRPLPPLKLNEGNIKSAEDLLSSITLHDGNTKDYIFVKKLEDIENRMSKYGAAFGSLNELIDYGNFDPEYLVTSLVVCDGNPDRRERNAIFNSRIRYVGISSGLMPSDRICTVLNFCEYYFNKGDLISAVLVDKYRINLRLVKKVENSDEVEEESNVYPFSFRTSEGNINQMPNQGAIAEEKGSNANLELNLRNVNQCDIPQDRTMKIFTDYDKFPSAMSTFRVPSCIVTPKDNIPVIDTFVNTLTEKNQNTVPIPTKASNAVDDTEKEKEKEKDLIQPKTAKLIEPIKSIKGSGLYKSKVYLLDTLQHTNERNIFKSSEKASKYKQETEKHKKEFMKYKTQTEKLAKQDEFKDLANAVTFLKDKVDTYIQFEESQRGKTCENLNPLKTSPVVRLDLDDTPTHHPKPGTKTYQIIKPVERRYATPSNMANTQIMYDHYDQIPMTSIQKEFKPYDIEVDLNCIERLPEKVKSIQMIEKPLYREGKQKETNESEGNENVYVKKIVKRVVNFKDGTSEVVYFEK